jgi:hypothetical protein
MSEKAQLVDIAVEVRHETDKAYLLFNGIRQTWVPKALVENNGDGTFAFPVWLAEDREFI